MNPPKSSGSAGRVTHRLPDDWRVVPQQRIRAVRMTPVVGLGATLPFMVAVPGLSLSLPTARTESLGRPRFEVRMVQGRKRDVARLKWIGELRARGWSFARIARKAGVSPQAIHHAVGASSRRQFIARCRLCRKPFPTAG